MVSLSLSCFLPSSCFVNDMIVTYKAILFHLYWKYLSWEIDLIYLLWTKNCSPWASYQLICFFWNDDTSWYHVLIWSARANFEKNGILVYPHGTCFLEALLPSPWLVLQSYSHILGRGVQNIQSNWISNRSNPIQSIGLDWI